MQSPSSAGKVEVTGKILALRPTSIAVSWAPLSTGLVVAVGRNASHLAVDRNNLHSCEILRRSEWFAGFQCGHLNAGSERFLCTIDTEEVSLKALLDKANPTMIHTPSMLEISWGC